MNKGTMEGWDVTGYRRQTANGYDILLWKLAGTWHLKYADDWQGSPRVFSLFDTAVAEANAMAEKHGGWR